MSTDTGKLAAVGQGGSTRSDAASAPARPGAERPATRDLLARLETTEDGLSSPEAERRLARFGANEIAQDRRGALRLVISYFWGPIPLLIEIAAVLSASVRHWGDLGIIAAMLFVNAGVGFWQEHKAESAIALLARRLALTAVALRDRRWREIAARELVPGDVVLVKLGRVVPADVRLLEGGGLSVDESALTGESLPVDKGPGDDAWSGSLVRRGEMKGLVTATGEGTWFGRTARLVQEAETRSHFQRAVLQIGDFLILGTLALVAVILLAALYRHDPLIEALLFALILTVAAVPVALPAVLSVTMAVGAERLARMKAIVSRLAAVEELAGMTVLCCDKTGTLTRNELTLGTPAPVDGVTADELVLAAALAADLGSPDAIDQAVLRHPAAATSGWRVLGLSPFDPATRRTEAEVERDGARFRVTKGAPRSILALVEADAPLRERIEQQVDALAAEGYRTIGAARTDAQGRWRLLGLLPLLDPPRDDSASTLAETRRLGVDVKMVTGDHLAIARRVAHELGLRGEVLPADTGPGAAAPGADTLALAAGYAEVLPEHKFEIVRALQARGEIVGMTGDGVNDAPALEQADVGIAVAGATDAARASADVVLTEPGLSVITRGIEESRRIFERMSAYAVYRISETIRVLLFMSLSILVFRFYPVTAVMVVLLALLNDFPIMMIAFDHVPAAPRPVSWEMGRVLGLATVLGVLGVLSTFLLFWLAEEVLRLPRAQTQTLIFLKLLVAGHLTIFLTRNAGPFWQRPWPALRLVLATEATQLVGTAAAAWGFLVEPIGWRLAVLVWAYALAWFLLNGAVKVAVIRMLAGGGSRGRSVSRVEALLHGEPLRRLRAVLRRPGDRAGLRPRGGRGAA